MLAEQLEPIPILVQTGHKEGTHQPCLSRIAVTGCVALEEDYVL